jgi:hypothetical protein
VHLLAGLAVKVVFIHSWSCVLRRSPVPRATVVVIMVVPVVVAWCPVLRIGILPILVAMMEPVAWCIGVSILLAFLPSAGGEVFVVIVVLSHSSMAVMTKAVVWHYIIGSV